MQISNFISFKKSSLFHRTTALQTALPIFIFLRHSIPVVRIPSEFYENATISRIDTTATLWVIKNIVALHKSWKQQGRHGRSMVGAFFMVMYSPRATAVQRCPLCKLHGFRSTSTKIWTPSISDYAAVLVQFFL